MNGSYGSYYGGSCIDCGYYNNYIQFVNYTTAKTGNSTQITIFLNQPLTNNSETTLYLFFSTAGIAHKTTQGYQFSFKTIIDPNALVRESYASVYVPENMYLKGEPSFNISYSKVSAAEGTVMSTTSPSDIGGAINSLFYYSSYQYHSSNLLPGEYFTITGLYGKSELLLYLPEIVIAIAVIIIIVLAFKFILWSRIKRLFSAKAKTNASKKGFNPGKALWVGVASGVLFQIAFFGMAGLYSIANFSYYYNNPLPILFALLGAVVCILALFGLPYYLCYRFSKKEGVLAGIIAIIASILILMAIFYVVYLLSPPVIYNYGI
jgi:hypothetical protein